MYIIIFILLPLLDITSCLDCYKCSSVRSPSDCDIVTVCSDQENCVTEAFSDNDNTMYTLGCRDQQLCVAPSIVGRSEDFTLQCRECCNTDTCNKQLCPSVQPITKTCRDDNSFDCQRADTFFHVCSDIQHAKVVCKEYCGLCDLVDGGWSVWNEWSRCDVTCGSGTRRRLRQCNNPAPSGNGLRCSGTNSDTSQCSLGPCPVNGGWSSWSSWGGCSASCGAGLRTRDRTCTSPTPEPNGQYCAGASTDNVVCILQACAVDGVWSVWTAWSVCSTTCGRGNVTRTRRCEFIPADAPHGKDCVGGSEEYQPCDNVTDCPVDGVWGTWTAWSTCSTSCGNEDKHRSRVCEFDPKKPRGDDCSGSNTNETSACNLGKCLVDGVFTDWSAWSACSVSCGNGNKTRSRTCEFNPPDAPKGQNCSGEYSQTNTCSAGLLCKGVFCQVCNDAADMCEVDYHSAECPIDKKYCINSVENFENAERNIIRKCGSQDECKSGWYDTYRLDNKCATFSEDYIYAGSFKCEFCCEGDNCNKRLNMDNKWAP